MRPAAAFSRAALKTQPEAVSAKREELRGDVVNLSASVRPATTSHSLASKIPATTDVNPSCETRRWYVAQTLARREVGAELQLVAQGFRVFLPQMLKTVRHARKLRTVRAAVFPGYLFVTLDLQRDRWRSVNGTIGVSRLVMGEDRPLPVPHGVVEALMAYVDESGVCRFDRDLVEGQAVRVVAGPFAEAIGQLIKLDAKGRVRVLLDIMGGKVIATLDRAALQGA